MLLRRALYVAGLALALAVSQAPAAEPDSSTTSSPTTASPTVLTHGGKATPAPDACLPPSGSGAAPDSGGAMADLFTAGRSERGGESAGSAIPELFGDQGGAVAPQCRFTFTLPGGTPQSLVFGVPRFFPAGTVFSAGALLNDGTFLPAGQKLSSGQTLLLIEPQQCKLSVPFPVNTARGAFKITENESPRPQDRVYTTYNFFDNVNGSQNPTGFQQTDIHREVIGFEKTFLDGDASIGMRLPFVQIEGDGSIRRSDVGDLSIVLKYAFVNDRDTGNVLSAGLVVTVPTGNSFLPQGVDDVHPTLLQPYVGGIYNLGSGFYVQGFSSIVVPTDSRDVTYWFNDVGVGYLLYNAGAHCDQLITSIVPIFEVHINTPLNHRGSDIEPVGGIDIVDLTFGATFGIRNRAFLNLGVVTPVTGPKPFDVEAQVQLNYRF